MSQERPLWRGSGWDHEPPPEVTRLRSVKSGHVMVRAGDVPASWRHEAVPAGTCEECGPPGTWWTWLHNGNSECWLEMDSVGDLIEERR